MKKISLISLMAGLLLIAGCGGDDGPTDSNGSTVITVTAATGSAPPARESVDDSVWTRITPKNVPITVGQFSSAGKRRPDNALAVASGVGVKALVVNNILYLRLAWDDATWDCWPGKLEVTSFHDQSGWAQFTRGGDVEDQMMVFFDGGLEYGWDVWHWRVATTGGGYLAEGAVLNGTSISVDPGTNDLVTLNHDPGYTSVPNYMHPEGPDNQSYQLLEADAVPMIFNTDSLPRNWAMGELVPGYVIDGTKYMENASLRGDRFDISSFAAHASDEHVVVLSRALNTGSQNDLDLTGPLTVDVRLGITNNTYFRFNSGFSEQGFSNTFKLNLP